MPGPELTPMPVENTQRQQVKQVPAYEVELQEVESNVTPLTNEALNVVALIGRSPTKKSQTGERFLKTIKQINADRDYKLALLSYGDDLYRHTLVLKGYTSEEAEEAGLQMGVNCLINDSDILLNLAIPFVLLPWQASTKSEYYQPHHQIVTEEFDHIEQDGNLTDFGVYIRDAKDAYKQEFKNNNSQEKNSRTKRDSDVLLRNFYLEESAVFMASPKFFANSIYKATEIGDLPRLKRILNEQPELKELIQKKLNIISAENPELAEKILWVGHYNNFIYLRILEDSEDSKKLLKVINKSILPTPFKNTRIDYIYPFTDKDQEHNKKTSKTTASEYFKLALQALPIFDEESKNYLAYRNVIIKMNGYKNVSVDHTQKTIALARPQQNKFFTNTSNKAVVSSQSTEDDSKNSNSNFSSPNVSPPGSPLSTSPKDDNSPIKNAAKNEASSDDEVKTKETSQSNNNNSQCSNVVKLSQSDNIMLASTNSKKRSHSPTNSTESDTQGISIDSVCKWLFVTAKDVKDPEELERLTDVAAMVINKISNKQNYYFPTPTV